MTDNTPDINNNDIAPEDQIDLLDYLEVILKGNKLIGQVTALRPLSSPLSSAFCCRRYTVQLHASSPPSRTRELWGSCLEGWEEGWQA
jgi:hypothetical protein